MPGCGKLRRRRPLQLLIEIDRICDLMEDVHLSQEPEPNRGSFVLCGFGLWCNVPGFLVGAWGKQIWKTVVLPRVQFFFWLTQHGRCWTVNAQYSF